MLERLIERNRRLLIGEDDPNDQRLQGKLAEGLTLAPLSTARGRRRGARERVEGAMTAHGLRVEFDALATRVLFDESRRAIGLEYRKGGALYRACPEPGREPGALRRVLARREVILAAGAFNTPQLLMLSGVGPPEELARHGIEARVPLEGVGRNLQDRYEVGVVHKLVSLGSACEASRSQSVTRSIRNGNAAAACGGRVLASLENRPLRGITSRSFDATFRCFAPAKPAARNDRLGSTDPLAPPSANRTRAMSLPSAGIGSSWSCGGLLRRGSWGSSRARTARPKGDA